MTRGEAVAYAPLNESRSNTTPLRIRRATIPIMHVAVSCGPLSRRIFAIELRLLTRAVPNWQQNHGREGVDAA